MMPAAAAASRGKQKAVLAGVLHDKSTSAALKDAIDDAKQHMASLNNFEQAVVRDAERNYRLAVGVPSTLEEKIAEHEVASVQAWIAARENDDFEAFAPFLSKMLALSKEKAVAMQPEGDAYDTLIDTFERGLSTARLTEIFSSIETPLKRLLEKTLAAKETCTRKVHPALLGGDDWDVQKQAELCRRISDALGFDFTKGRIGKCNANNVFKFVTCN